MHKFLVSFEIDGLRYRVGIETESIADARFLVEKQYEPDRILGVRKVKFIWQ